MATSLTFTTLTTQIQGFLERGGSTVTDATTTAQIPYAINGAERSIMQLLRLQGEIEVLTDPAGLGVGLPIIPKPDRWRVTISLGYGTGTSQTSYKPLFPRALEYCQAYWPDSSVTSADNPPQFYADLDLANWYISPTPDQGYPLRAVCYMQPPLLDSANQQNFFTTYTPNLLLYTSLLEMTPFLKDDPRIPVWQTKADREAQALAGTDFQKIMDRSAERRSA